MNSLVDSQIAQVKVRRYSDSTACDVLVLFRGHEMVLGCRDYSQAIKWARVECKAYGIPTVFVERASKTDGRSDLAP